MAWRRIGGYCRGVHPSEHDAISIEHDVSGHKINAIVMEIVCRIEWEVCNYIVARIRSVVSCELSRFGLEDQVYREGLIFGDIG